MILDKIIEEKKKEVERAQEKVSLAELIKKASSGNSRLRDFKQAISQSRKINLIAEIKKASPSQGILREDFDLLEIAKAYKGAGACALSILTDKKFFQGDIKYLQAVREVVNLPILRKDFIIDKYQIYESICAGADAVLLIVRILSDEQLKEFSALCTQLTLEAVFEVHSEQDLERVLLWDPTIIGINNRDLDNFEINLQLSSKLIKKIPTGKVIISESGIKSFDDVKYLRSLGVNSVLIGEAFMRSKDIAAKVREVMYGES